MNKLIARRDRAILIIKQKGSCDGLYCNSCPFYYANEEGKFDCLVSTPDIDRVPIFIQYLVSILGEQEAKEILVEELI